MDISEQLAWLRRTAGQAAERADRKYAPLPRPVAEPEPAEPLSDIHDLLTGEARETEYGRHFETEKLYARHRRHGNFDISDLECLPHNLLESLSGGVIPSVAPGSLAFLDTETTGLAGGSGTYAFLIGVGSIEPEGFRVKQFFLRDYADERSVLHSLSKYLERFEVLVTYNGRTYDQPLLETRYTMCRARHPFARMEHLDLLYGARRLYKLRLENCRLVSLENEILGVERHGDIPGEMIPYCYFEYLRTRRANRMVPIFEHNVQDIVSLACLTALIPEAFRDPHGVRARHGSDLIGIGRWLQMSGRSQESCQILRRAVQVGLPDHLLFRTLFDIGSIEKKMGQEHASVATFTDLTESPNPYRAKAYEELAKFYEHKDRNYSMALECTRAARKIEDSEALRNRQDRLEAKCLKPRQPRLKLRAHA